jgi:quercetin 2,3-dioxygenase
MSTKNVEAIITPPAPHFVGDGFRVHNYIPSSYLLSMQRMSPFIMLDYNSPHYFPPTNTPRGVSVHPHRGFETVTIAYKGKIAHNDSAGNSGIIGEGDVQWMTAASGILHKEYHEENFSKEGGEFQMVQLWVNLPAKDKMSTPKYQEITNAQMGKYNIDDNGSNIDVIAGSHNNVQGAANTFTPVHLINVTLKNGVSETFNFPVNYNTGLVIIEGAVTVNGTEQADANEFVLLKNDGETFTIHATSDAKILVLSGEPINEPIAAHGPFVMNTQQEIVQAFNDYQNGKFGVLH